MFNIELDQTAFGSLIKNFPARANKNRTNKFFVPSNIGDGNFDYLNLPNGLQCVIADFKLKQDLYLNRKPLNEEFYVLRFDEFATANNLMVKIDSEYFWEYGQQRNSVLLTSSLFDFAFMASKGTSTKSIIVLLKKDWLSRYFNGNDISETLKKYLKVKTNNYNFSPFDIEYKTLFKEIMEERKRIKVNNAIVEKCIMMLIEKFIKELSYKLSTIKENDKIKISPDEVRRLIEAESCLVRSSTSQAPSIYSLSKIAAMSTTTLKNKFKKMYGYTLYGYFQKSRMQRAKVMLLSGSYSIKEIGSQLGYCNLSNFSIAFKKEFNCLPSHFVINFVNNKL